MTDQGYVGDGVTLPKTPQEALDLLVGYIDVTGDSGQRPDLEAGMNLLQKFITQVQEHGSTDLEWGEPGDCWERIENDPDIREELALITAPFHEEYTDTTERREREGALAKEAGLGRHYGDPHCIWCLQAD